MWPGACTSALAAPATMVWRICDTFAGLLCAGAAVDLMLEWHPRMRARRFGQVLDGEVGKCAAVRPGGPCSCSKLSVRLASGA